MIWFAILAVCMLGLWAIWANAKAEQEVRSAICERIRARGAVIPGVLEEMGGLPGPGEQMPARPGDTACEAIAGAVAR